jgi:hypothetical protein
VQGSHDGYGFEIKRVLRLGRVDLVAWDEGEVADVAMEFGEGEFGAVEAEAAKEREIELIVRLEIVQGEALKVG